MKVKELISLLQELPMDNEVQVCDSWSERTLSITDITWLDDEEHVMIDVKPIPLDESIIYFAGPGYVPIWEIAE